jgi:Fe-S-cluster containining protein
MLSISPPSLGGDSCFEDMKKQNNKKNTIRIAGSDAVALEPSDPVQLTCGTSGCSSNCCTNGPHIILNPYEIALLCKAAGMSYEDLLDIVETDRVNGFPLIMLPRDPACHFWTETGCRIYEARPLACRLFPLGRVFESGHSYIVLPDRNRCTGLVPAPAPGSSLSPTWNACTFPTNPSHPSHSICWCTVRTRRQRRIHRIPLHHPKNAFSFASPPPARNFRSF